MTQASQEHTIASQPGNNLFENFRNHGSLATLPLTASLPNSFRQSFGTSSCAGDILPDYMANHLPVTTASMAPGGHMVGSAGGPSAATDHFLEQIGTLPVGITLARTYDRATPDGIPSWNKTNVISVLLVGPLISNRDTRNKRRSLCNQPCPNANTNTHGYRPPSLPLPFFLETE